MERDYLGLRSKILPVDVKEEITNGSEDSAKTRGSTMQWSFSNKASAAPQILSFKASQDDGPRKTAYDSPMSTRYMTISTADAVETDCKPFTSSLQKNSTSDEQVGAHYTVTTYPRQQFNAHSVFHPHEVGAFPISNQTNQKISLPMSTTAHQPLLASTVQNIIGSVIHPQPLGGVPVISPASVIPTSTSVVGTTDLRSAAKPSASPAQLTIFYAGSVCVYDDVSPEKAQAIMLLAGNGNSAIPTKKVPSIQSEAPASRPGGPDGFVGNQGHNTSACTGLPATIAVASCAVPQPAGGSISTSDIKVVRSIGPLPSPSNKSEPSEVVNLRGPVSATLVPSAVPQARKASLARFLEKRKERVTSASPYMSKQSPDCGTPKPDSMSFSVKSEGSCSFAAIN
ncbi:hypothetical protein NMG60_11031038 [Bertholletia excelsa]